jgi:ribosomal protein L11 methylase PrmA
MSEILDASFRDPSGFLFEIEGRLYRQVNKVYQNTFEALEESGLFQALIKKKLLIPHSRADTPSATDSAYCVIEPQRLPFISYPYEWSFSQLKDAALLTLRIQSVAMEHGFSLKDASAYNVQFLQGKPIFIDTLSFESLPEGKPWIAYRQFCQHFLAPLALMARTDISLQQLLRNNIDGIPLSLASKLLPFGTGLRFSLLVHIHLHARSQKAHADKAIRVGRSFSLHSFKAVLDSLRTAINKLVWLPEGTEWDDYYEANNNYESGSLELKETLVRDFLAEVKPQSVWDLGANTGRFSKIAAELSELVCAWDIDPACVEKMYLSLRQESQQQNIYPLLLDLSNPSPAIGWANNERFSFVERGGADLVMALGLIHHLVISNNVPMKKLAAFFATIANHIIIEFIPKEDSQVIKLLSTREDIFPEYERQHFERDFGDYFSIQKSTNIDGSTRTLYLMSRKS